jgi:broad-specificity NMP kinase
MVDSMRMSSMSDVPPPSSLAPLIDPRDRRRGPEQHEQEHQRLDRTPVSVNRHWRDGVVVSSQDRQPGELGWLDMTRVLVTGMSGTGKSSVLIELGRRGHRVVDTDYSGWSEDVTSPDGSGWERLWREDRISALLAEDVVGSLFVSGCVSNQGKFYDRFDAVVLLSLSVDVLLERVAARVTNPYGKDPAERERIIEDHRMVEPLLRATATAEINTDRPLHDVVDEVEALAQRTSQGYRAHCRLEPGPPVVL